MQEIKALEQLAEAMDECYERVDAAAKYFASRLQETGSELTVMETHFSEAQIALMDKRAEIGGKITFVREVAGLILTVLGYPKGFGEYQWGQPGTKEAGYPYPDESFEANEACRPEEMRTEVTADKPVPEEVPEEAAADTTEG